jgi:3-hydroxybutyryl-CoA dehydrogenase
MISTVLIVGAGWVGRQVAARMAQHSVCVLLFDRNQETAADAMRWMRELPAVAPSSHEFQPAPDWLNGVTVLRGFDMPADAREEIDMVLECVPEQISLKKRVLREVSELFPSCIIASNSSYFVPSTLSQFVTRSERFAHMHFHVPVLRESVCDIVGCSQTDPLVLSRLAELAQRMRQPPIMLRREQPGYVFNWLLQSVLKGALELVANDVVDAQQVDQSWKAVTGMPLGPFGIMDQIGLDVIEQVLCNARWVEPTVMPNEQLLSVLRPLIAAGKLGVKTQAGFYEYDNSMLPIKVVDS